MPIEDIDYLRKNSIKQSYIFLVDSKDRNKSIYRTPSEYVVEFTKPFENVIGLEVLDASIPRTMYNVDAYNNHIRFFIYSSNYSWDSFMVPSSGSVNIPWKDVYIEPGDYTVQTLIPAINSKLSMHLNNDSNLPLVSLSVASVSNPPDIKNTLMVYGPYPFLLDMKNSTMAETLGFDMHVTSTESELYDIFQKNLLLTSPVKQSIYQQLPSKEDIEILTTVPIEYKGLVHTLRDVYTNQQLYKSVDKPFILGDSTTYGYGTTIFEGPRSVIRKFPISSNAYIAQHFTVSAQQYLTSMQIAFTTDYTIDVDTSAQYAIYTGTSNEPSIILENRKASGNIGITAVDGAYSTAQLSQTCFLEPNTHYWLVVSNTDNRDLSVYFNNVANKGTNSMVVSTNTGTTWSLLDEPDIPFQMSCALLGNYEHHEIISPGIYNLVGEKYVVLRCKEIEENSYRSLAFAKYNLGLAKFRLGVVGYSDSRMDFSKVPLREFHPIGRLVKLSLRFETGNGGLYDFKGVNHTITFAIHYLEPHQKLEFAQSILNPNYTGNFIDYRFREDDQEGDSDDQEEDFSRDVVGNYKKYETKYLPENVRLQNLPVVYRDPRFILQENDNTEDDEEYEENIEEEY